MSDGATGRLLAMGIPGVGEVEQHYDRAGRLVAQHLPSGASARFDYDEAGRVREIRHREAAGADLWVGTYAYDPNGNRSALTVAGVGTESYAYDALDRLSVATYADASEQRFGYDAVGNRLYQYDRGAETWLHPDAAGRIEKVSLDPAGLQVVAAYTYDANGNPTRRQTPTMWTSFTYDPADRLVAVLASNADAWRYRYDAAGRRIEQTAPEKTRRYVWSGGNRIAEYEGVFVTQRYYHGPGLDDVVARQGTGGTTYFHPGALSSVRAMTDASGASLATWAYDAFGARRDPTGSDPNDLAFTGREQDSNGLLYYRARFYDPALGRFLTEDPSGFAGSDVNLYAYAANNPATLRDPTGRITATTQPDLFVDVSGGPTPGRPTPTATRNPEPSLLQRIGFGIDPEELSSLGRDVAAFGDQIAGPVHVLAAIEHFVQPYLLPTALVTFGLAVPVSAIAAALTAGVSLPALIALGAFSLGVGLPIAVAGIDIGLTQINESFGTNLETTGVFGPIRPRRERER